MNNLAKEICTIELPWLKEDTGKKWTNNIGWDKTP